MLKQVVSACVKPVVALFVVLQKSQNALKMGSSGTIWVYRGEHPRLTHNFKHRGCALCGSIEDHYHRLKACSFLSVPVSLLGSCSHQFFKTHATYR